MRLQRFLWLGCCDEKRVAYSGGWTWKTLREEKYLNEEDYIKVDAC